MHLTYYIEYKVKLIFAGLRLKCKEIIGLGVKNCKTNVYWKGWGKMFFFNSFQKKTVKELRKNKGLTAKELAFRLKIDTPKILRIDDKRLKDVQEPLKSLILPILRGDDTDKMPWL